MTVTANSFRSNFQEFADHDTYPESLVNFYVELAYKLLREDVWGDTRDYAISLWVAHNLTVAGAKLEDGADSGMSGPMTSQHVGEVGFTSNPQYFLSGALKDAGFYARTTYGAQYWQLASMFGAGGLQL